MASVRLWKEGDTPQCIKVLREASWSNVWPSYILTIKKRWFSQVTGLSAVGCYLVTNSAILFVFSILVVFFTTLVLQVLGNMFYIYFHLRDMHHVEKEYFSNPDSCFLVAEVKFDDIPPVIVGTIAIVRRASDSNTAWLRRMAVLNAFRGYGIGQLLVGKAIQFSSRRKYNKIMLITTEVHKAARALYTKMGFKVRNYKPYSYVGGWVKIWTYEMECDLVNPEG